MSAYAGNSSEMSGHSVAARTGRDSMLENDASGNFTGQTYTGTDSSRLTDSYESIFGPAGRDIKNDPQRHKRHQRWHLPDNLKGRNEYLTDRIDGLITDATSSPFTRNILPYVYLDSPDQKIKWNVYIFDEGMASRVPYESAARVLTQSKTSHAGYAVRQGLAIVMDHNFLASAAGMANFQNQLKQLVGSIQLTNDLDVHIALLQAQSYQKTINDKYYSENDSLYDAARRYVDMFGVMQKIPNALDILIEDAKNHLKTWGSPPPTFLLCPSDLTAQLQMNPERTNYITNGPDGLKRLAQGPDLPSYCGLSIIHSQKFSLEPGRKPRNVLKRRVRVAEYYWIPLADVSSYQIYNQKKDMMTTFDRTHALRASDVESSTAFRTGFPADYFGNDGEQWSKLEPLLRDGYCLLIRPNIEHEMLTVIAGRGGTQELGATFWGQTELACYDDAQHGIWGMSYKYHERAIVTNERNLIRMHDVAFDGYGGGMDTDIVKNADLEKYTSQTYNNEPHFKGESVIALHFPRYLPPRSIDNQIVSLLMDTFVCDPDDRCSTTLNDSQLEFRSKVLTAIAAALKAFFITHNDYFAIIKALDDDAEADHARLTREKEQNQTDNWPAFTTNICQMIREVHTVYRTARPHEDPYEVYRRILQNTYKMLYAPAHSMSLATANRVLSYLRDNTTGRDVKSEEFKRAFDATMALMLLNKSMIANDAINAAIATVQGSVALNDVGSRVNIKTYITYLIHGYIVEDCRNADCNAWNVHVEGGPQIQRAGAVFPSDGGNDNSDKDVLFNRLLLSIHDHTLNDYRYLVHRMQKPAFEVPNPVILGTFLGNRITPTPVDAEGSQMIDKDGKHDFATQFKNYFTETGNDFTDHGIVMQTVIQRIFENYRKEGSYLWTGGNSMPASSYMQNSTTELPSLAYHGNLTIDRTLKGREDIRCVGHLGNSFPGCACIRQGKGMLNMYERQPTAVHVM
jgi:hypothetical protein